MQSKIVEFEREFPIHKIKEDQRARKDYGEVDKFALELKEHGIINPLTIDSTGRLIAGGRRLAAAKMAKLKTVPVNIIDKATDVTYAEIELFENLHRKDLAWHEEAELQKRLFEYYKEQVGVGEKFTLERAGVMLGVSKTELHRRIILADFIETVPELKQFETASQAEKYMKATLRNIEARKDTQELEERLEQEEFNEEYIYQVDSADDKPKPKHYTDTLPKGIPAWVPKAYIVGNFLELGHKQKKGSFHCAEVDPPYGIDLTGEARKQSKAKEKHDRYNEVSAEEYVEFLEQTAQLTYDLLADKTFCIWWFGLQWYGPTMEVLRKVGFKFHHIPGIWTKYLGQTTNPTVNLGHAYETFFLCRKGSAQLYKQGGTNVFNFDSIRGDKKYHATQKPLALLVSLLKIACPTDGTVLVPFAGSGVTIAAAARYGRKAIGWDLDSRNRDLFLTRCQDIKQDVYIPHQ